MRCEDAHPLLGAYGDGELDDAQRQEIAAHSSGCGTCAAMLDEDRRVVARLKCAAYERAPPDLAARISARIALVDEQAARLPAPSGPPRHPSRAAPWLLRAATILIACGLSAAASWYLTRASMDQSRLSRDLLTAHVRSLLPDTTVQVASSDRQTVKPWFTGKLEFSPSVKDLTAEGFPLIGGRLDYLGERRVAVVVYKRRQHVINVFSWPAAQPVAGTPLLGPRSLAVHGYTGQHWSADGLEHWAVSNLNEVELAQVQKLLSP